MRTDVTFEELEKTALRFALTMSQDDVSMLEVSERSIELAMQWHEHQPTRMKMFYSNPENRKDWIKASTNKISVSDVGIGFLEKETSYWIIPVGENFPIFTKLISFDGPDAEFETLDKKGSYYAREILVVDSQYQTAKTNEEEVPIQPIPSITNYWG